jgi:uncharacterized protein YciI
MVGVPSRAGAAVNVGDGPYAAVMSNFAVRLVHGPGWDPSRQIRDQDGWAGHAAFMHGLVDDGFIILGGPVGDGEQTLHAVEAADENEIRAHLAADPWATAGLLRIGTIEPWALWLDGRPDKPARSTAACD